jgi:ABC-type branched-subunit amino acid transport system substrate-binding protein
MRFVLALGLAGVVASSACSLLIATNNDQCGSPADCIAKGPMFANTQCVDNICVASPADVNVADTTPFDAGSDAGSDTGVDAAPAVECTVTSECNPKKSTTSICRSDGVCVELVSPDCNYLAGDYKSDDAIVIGSIFSTSGSGASTGIARRNSVELAINEISQTVVGLPGGRGGKPRPLAFVGCDDAYAPDGGPGLDPTRAAKHLVEALHVPAIVGPASSGNTVSVAQNVSIPGGTLIISPSATSIPITTLVDKNLVWRTAPSDTIQAIADIATINELETQVKGELAIPKVRVYVGAANTAYGNGLRDAILASLKINDKTVADPSNTAFFKQSTFDPANATAKAAVATDIINFAPHIVFLVGTSEVPVDIMKPVEDGWTSSTPHPYYVLPDGARRPEVITLVTGNDTLRKHVRGTVPGTNNELYVQFGNRYAPQFGGTFPSLFGMAGAYDAVYLIAYGIVAGGANPPTGASVATGLTKMVGGTKVDVGKLSLSTTFQALQSGGSIDINGTSGPLDFDLATGEAASDIDVWCIGLDATPKPVFKSSGRHYNAQTKVMEGVIDCQ